MTIRLTGGAYQARSIIAAAQRQLNLFAEPMPQAEGEPAPMACYPTPGLRRLATLPDSPVRGLRQASNGTVYAVAGSGVYRLDAVWDYRLLGRIQGGHTPVSMADNGLSLVIVDGSSFGWSVSLSTDAFAQITDATGSFVGGSSAGYLDTYLLFSAPGSPKFYASDSLALTFDPLWFANKEAAPDSLVALAVAKAEIWLLGERSTEVWFDAGAADFPFQRQQGVFIDNGCAAVASVAVLDNQVYWLTRNRQGQGLVVRGGGYQATRVSTYALEAEIASYDSISDAVGMSYSQAGHMFYVLSFPAADKTWMYDATTQLWSELAWIDNDGAEHRHRANCMYLCGGTVVCGDWESGKLYALDRTAFTDDGQPIKRVRAFPHLLADGKRVFYRQFIADVEAGQPGTLYLDWSDDRGRSFSNPIANSFGGTGEYLTQLQYQRLGMARDRVFRLSTSDPIPFALQGAWISATPATS